MPERKEKYGISVIMPCYNAEKYIEETLESVLAQTFKDFEIILIDDGSTDSTKEIIDKYAEKYNNITAYHQDNHGQGYERNFGVKKRRENTSTLWIVMTCLNLTVMKRHTPTQAKMTLI